MRKKFLAYRNILINYIFKILPINNRYFYFCSFHGQYSDSPKYISELLYNQYPNAIFIWEVSEKSKEILPSYIKKVSPNSIKALLYRSISKIIIDNYLGWSYGYAIGFKYYLLFNQKKKGQFCICFWHGTPLKKIGIDMPTHVKDRNMKFYSTADILICGNHYTASILQIHSQKKLPIKIYGMPRNDILFNQKTNKVYLKKKLGLPTNKKIVLYAPTFRENIIWCGIKQLSDLDINKLLSKISEKFGGEFIFVFRAHDSVIESLEFRKLKKNGVIFSGNVGDDMAEYLAITDVLITDYSSSMFDFIFSYKPCFLYCPDIKNYELVERGFYIKLNELPFPLANDINDLFDNIDFFDIDTYSLEIKQFLQFLGNKEDGHATQKVVKIINKQLMN